MFCAVESNGDEVIALDLGVVAWISIGVAGVCAMVIAVDEMRHPQKMGVMNVVWPVTALYFSVFAVWAYFTIGRRSTRAAKRDIAEGMDMADMPKGPPTPAQVAVGTSHCGAGCMIADVGAEFGIALAGVTLLGSVLLAEYAIDFAAAWSLGIVFQYFAIRPMRPRLSKGAVVWSAVKADTLSILAFQVGMYAWMAFVHFKLFATPHLTVFDPRYWMMMQMGMMCGFLTSLPMNRLLIGLGWKEAM